MKEIIAGVNESGQRLDKLLHKYLSQAGSGFIYKMLRKKNIVLNDKKAGGNEILSPGDSIKLYLSDETLTLTTGRSITSGNEHSKDHAADKAVKASKSENDKKAKKTRDSRLPNLPKHCIVYEDANLLVINKPAGWLSQSDGSKAPSANEICLNYLIRKGELTESQMETFKPGIANRLDRNTSGLLLFGKTLPALQELGKNDKVVVVGNDFTSEAKAAIKDGTLDASVAMSPYLGGRATMITMIRASQGKKIGTVSSYVPMILVSKDNVKDMEDWK